MLCQWIEKTYKELENNGLPIKYLSLYRAANQNMGKICIRWFTLNRDQHFIKNTYFSCSLWTILSIGIIKFSEKFQNKILTCGRNSTLFLLFLLSNLENVFVHHFATYRQPIIFLFFIFFFYRLASQMLGTLMCVGRR